MSAAGSLNDASSTSSAENLPAGWKSFVSRSTGRIFYQNERGETTWKHPLNPGEKDASLPWGWKKYSSRKTGEVFYM
jgi:hypothetical protein